MGEGYKRPKGFADIYGSLADKYAKLEQCAKNVFSTYNYHELRTPIVEHTELFQRSIGEETDVVQKEMFTFPDRKGRLLTLRPEATAGVLRACIENGFVAQGQITRLYTIGPMFRYERPQKGRMRQFHQINCECLGTDSPVADAEIISMLLQFLKSAGLINWTLKLNSLGCSECRPPFLQKLREFLAAVPEEALCPDCLRRRDVNPLRVFDCKESGCRNILQNAPALRDNICTNCKTHFEETIRLLKLEGIEWELDPWLVRGLDYYQKLAFEVVSNEIGAQTAIAGGGRYDGLLKQLGGPDISGIGFACGMERLSLLMPDEEEKRLGLYVIGTGSAEREKAFIIVQNLRARGIRVEMNYRNQSFKSLMRMADRSGAPLVMIIGADELKNNTVIVKSMIRGEQVEISQTDIFEKPLLLASLKDGRDDFENWI